MSEWWAKTARRGITFAVDVVRSSIEFVWVSLVDSPLRTLYFHGPHFKGIGGFWNGASEADACAQLTGVSSTVWGMQIEACRDLLDRNYTSFYVAVIATVYIVCLYKVLQILAFRYFYVQPVMAELRAMLRDREKTFPDSCLDNTSDVGWRGCFRKRPAVAADLSMRSECKGLCETAVGGHCEHGDGCQGNASSSGRCVCGSPSATPTAAEGADQPTAVHEWHDNSCKRRRASSPQVPRRSTSA